jgi:hypothetical protein
MAIFHSYVKLPEGKWSSWHKFANALWLSDRPVLCRSFFSEKLRYWMLARIGIGLELACLVAWDWSSDVHLAEASSMNMYIQYEQQLFSLIWDQIIFVLVYLVYCAVEELNFFSSCCGKCHKSRLNCIYFFKNDECFIHNMSNIQIVYKCIVVPWRKHVGANPPKISPLQSKSNMIYILQTRYTLATQGL